MCIGHAALFDISRLAAVQHMCDHMLILDHGAGSTSLFLGDKLISGLGSILESRTDLPLIKVMQDRLISSAFPQASRGCQAMACAMSR